MLEYMYRYTHTYVYFPFTTPHIQKAFYLMFPYSTCIDNDTHSVRTAGLHTVKRTERYQSTSCDIVYVKLSDERWLVNKTILPTNRVKVVLAFKGYTSTHVHVHFLSQSCLLVCVTPLLFSSDSLGSVTLPIPGYAIGTATRPKIESRFEDVNVRDTVRNYSIGTFIWGSPIVFFV